MVLQTYAGTKIQISKLAYLKWKMKLNLEVFVN